MGRIANQPLVPQFDTSISVIDDVLSVLLVEPNEALRADISYKLNSLGIKVYETLDEDLAIKIVQNCRIEAIFIDTSDVTGLGIEILAGVKCIVPDITAICLTPFTWHSNASNVLQPSKSNKAWPITDSPKKAVSEQQKHFKNLPANEQLSLLVSTELNLRLLKQSLDELDFQTAELSLAALKSSVVLHQFFPLLQQVTEAHSHIVENKYPVGIISEICDFTLKNFDSFSGSLNEEPFASNFNSIRDKLVLN